jgi:ERCC4-type nuclease
MTRMPIRNPLDEFHAQALDAIHAQEMQREARKEKQRKTAEKPLEMIHVLIDTREQNPWTFSKYATVERVTLTDGDYSLKDFSDQIRIERKSLADLTQTITKGRDRFYDECKRLMAYKRAALIIEATMYDVEAECYRSRVSSKSVLGTIHSCWIRFGLVPLFAGNHRDAGRLCEWLFRKYREIWRE